MERMKQWVILFMRSWASKWNAEKRLPENLQVASYQLIKPDYAKPLAFSTSSMVLPNSAGLRV